MAEAERDRLDADQEWHGPVSAYEFPVRPHCPPTSDDSSLSKEAKELFRCSKSGDLSGISSLRRKGLDLNQRDMYNNTPIYYACHRGYVDMVRYMLNNGVKFDEEEYDAERCSRSALTTEIMVMIKQHKKKYGCVITRSLKPVQPDNHQAFLERMLLGGDYSDVTILVAGASFRAHRCIMATRSTFFNRMFHTRWKDMQSIRLNHSWVSPTSFAAILQYIYTGQSATQYCQLRDILKIAKHCEIWQLVTEITKLRALYSSGKIDGQRLIYLRQKTNGCTLKSDLCQLIKQIHETVDPAAGHSDQGLLEVSDGLAGLAHGSIYQDGLTASIHTPAHTSKEAAMACSGSKHSQLFSDVIICVIGQKFACHKVFLCGRSEYFQRMFVDHFGELSEAEGNRVPIGGLDDETFRQILHYIYTGSCQELTSENLYDILLAADMFLMSQLKQQCAETMERYLDSENVVSVLRCARLLQLKSLERACLQCIAMDIDQVLNQELFTMQITEEVEVIKPNGKPIPTIAGILPIIRSNPTSSQAKELLIINYLENLQNDLSKRPDGVFIASRISRFIHSDLKRSAGKQVRAQGRNEDVVEAQSWGADLVGAQNRREDLGKDQQSENVAGSERGTRKQVSAHGGNEDLVEEQSWGAGLVGAQNRREDLGKDQQSENGAGSKRKDLRCCVVS